METTGLIHLGTAYGAFFLLLAFYVNRLRLRDRELWRRLQELEDRLDRAGDGPRRPPDAPAHL